MAFEMRRVGDGFVADVTGRSTVGDATGVVDHVESAGGECRFLIIDFTRTDTIDFSLDDLHAITRRLRDLPDRFRRHAFVGTSGGVASHVADYETMVEVLTDTWSEGAVEIALFDTLDEALEWVDEPEV